MGFDSAPRLTTSDKRTLAENAAPLGYKLSGWDTIDFNFIRADYINAWDVGQPIKTITKHIHNRTTILETLPSGGFHINAWDSVTTRKKLGLVLPSTLRIVMANHTQWLVDISKGLERAEWHRGDDFVVSHGSEGHAWEITGGDAWAVGPKLLKRNMIDHNPSFGA